MTRKTIIFTTIIVTSIILFYLSYKFFQIRQVQEYKLKVDNYLYEKVVEMNENKERLRGNIIFRPEVLGRPEKELIWGDMKVRLNDEIVKTKDSEGYNTEILYEIIQVKNPNSDWQNLIRKGASSFCAVAVVKDENLLCVGSRQGSIVLNIINKNGLYKTKTLVSSPNNVGDSFYLDGSILYFVFTDDRFVWSLPIPDDAPHKMGTQFLMAGVLDINTLDFKEVVIGYADVKYYDGYSDTILIPDIKQSDNVKRLESGAFIK